MSLELYLAFFVATTIMILLPGPSVMLTIAHSLSFGPVRALSTVTGAVCGVGVQLAVALAGMTSIMLLLADWFEVLRWVGVAYLVYLGIQQWRAPIVEDGEGLPPAVSGRSLWLQGFVVTLPNPKSLLFLAAFFPQFVDPTAPPVLQALVLGTTFLAIAFVFTAVWAFVAAAARGFIRSRRGVLWRNRITGSLMIGAGLGLALARRG